MLIDIQDRFPVTPYETTQNVFWCFTTTELAGPDGPLVITLLPHPFRDLSSLSDRYLYRLVFPDHLPAQPLH